MSWNMTGLIPFDQYKIGPPDPGGEVAPPAAPQDNEGRSQAGSLPPDVLITLG